MAANERKESLISIVDDEACVRESLSSLIRSVGYKTKEHASAEDFLRRGRWDETACLILDVRLPGGGWIGAAETSGGDASWAPDCFHFRTRDGERANIGDDERSSRFSA